MYSLFVGQHSTAYGADERNERQYGKLCQEAAAIIAANLSDQSAVSVQVPSLICKAVFFSSVSLTESPALSSNDLRTVP